jgi:hypothetical protein
LAPRVAAVLERMPGPGPIGILVAAITAAVLAVESDSRGFGGFFVHRPVEAGFLSGVLLTLVVSVIISAVVDSIRDVKWKFLSIAAFEAVAYEVTLVIDGLNALVTGLPVMDGVAKPVPRTCPLLRPRTRPSFP